MPVSSAIAIGAGAISAGTSIVQGISASNRARDIQKQIDNYKRQNLKNHMEGLQVSTLGADRQREDLARSVATSSNLASMGGSRAIAGTLPTLISQQAQQEAQITANLDEQEKNRQQLIAQGNMQVQQLQEEREKQDLAGLGTALNTARQEQTNAMNNLASTTAGIASYGIASANNAGLTLPNNTLPKKPTLQVGNVQSIQGINTQTPISPIMNYMINTPTPPRPIFDSLTNTQTPVNPIMNNLIGDKYKNTFNNYNFKPFLLKK